MVATFGVCLGATNVNALENTPSKVTSTNNISKRASLVLQEEYEGGII